MSQTRADPSSPVPSQETGTYFISLGQVRPRYQPPPPVPSSFRAPHPAGQDSGCAATPSFGERRPQPQTPGAPGGGTSQPPERCPTRETHVMKPGEGGQVAPSLPGSGQTCLESQGRTRSFYPPTRSHLTQPAASPYSSARPLRQPPPLPLRPKQPPFPPASPPAPLLIHLARTAQTAQRAHTASLCAEREPEAAGTPSHARPQLSGASKPRLLPVQRIARKLRLAQRNIPLETLGSSLPGQSFLRRSAKCRQKRAVAPARRIMERIPSAQPPPTCLPKAPGLEHGDLSG